MAGQPARAYAGETTREFMERRRREIALREQFEAAGRKAWFASTRSGANLIAARPESVRRLGVSELRPASPQRAPAGGARPSEPRQAPARADRPVTHHRPPERAGSIRYGGLYAPAPSPADLAALRRRQAELAQGRQDFDRDHWILAFPALAPAAAILAVEAPGLLAAALAKPALRRVPLVLTKREPYLRVGDNWATRAGRRAHAALKARVKAKPGWDAEEAVPVEGGIRRPDVRGPARWPAKPDKRYQMEMKPNTPSGRRAGARAAKRYTEQTGQKTRAIYYDPKDFM